MIQKHIHLLSPVSGGEKKCLNALCHLYGERLPEHVYVHRDGDMLLIKRELDPRSDDLYVIWAGVVYNREKGEIYRVNFSLKFYIMHLLIRLGLWRPDVSEDDEKGGRKMEEFFGALASTLLLAGVFAMAVYGLGGMFGAY